MELGWVLYCIFNPGLKNLAASIFLENSRQLQSAPSVRLLCLPARINVNFAMLLR